MRSRKVLWIEDNADSDLYHLTSPVYIDGRFHLDLATNISEAFFYLNKRNYDVIIVDIRIPPGRDPEWVKRYEDLQKANRSNSNRLGLELLKVIFSKSENSPKVSIEENVNPRRFGIFTVERSEELESELKELNLEEIKFKRKNAMMPHTALLDFINEIHEANEKIVS